MDYEAKVLLTLSRKTERVSALFVVISFYFLSTEYFDHILVCQFIAPLLLPPKSLYLTQLLIPMSVNSIAIALSLLIGKLKTFGISPSSMFNQPTCSYFHSHSRSLSSVNSLTRLTAIGNVVFLTRQNL